MVYSSFSRAVSESKEQKRDAAIAAVLTARRGGKKLGEAADCGCDDKSKSKKNEGEEDPRSIPTKVNLIKNKLRALGAKNPIVMVTTEGTADDALAIMRKRIADRHGAKSLIGSPENKKDTEERKAEKQPKPKRKLKGYSIPGAPKEKSYND